MRDDFVDMFIISGIAEQFAGGVPKFVSGLSGTELVWEVLNRIGTNTDLPEPQIEYEYSPEYWCGWILAIYQWNTGKSFKEIKKYLPMSEIYKLYPTLHEASEEKFVDVANSILERKNCRQNYRQYARQSDFRKKNSKKVTSLDKI